MSASSLKILISYRREDSAGYAGRLYDDLTDRVGRGGIFIDIDAIEPGLDFTEVIEREVGSADVVLVIIGRRWVSIEDARGRRRLENPSDYHRLEIEAALERNIRVIPVLVQDAPMPAKDELPESIARLAHRNALELSDRRWNYDLGLLVEALDRIGNAKAGAAPETSPPKVQEPETADTTPPPPPPSPPPPIPSSPAALPPAAPAMPPSMDMEVTAFRPSRKRTRVRDRIPGQVAAVGAGLLLVTDVNVFSIAAVAAAAALLVFPVPPRGVPHAVGLLAVVTALLVAAAMADDLDLSLRQIAAFAGAVLVGAGAHLAQHRRVALGLSGVRPPIRRLVAGVAALAGGAAAIASLFLAWEDGSALSERWPVLVVAALALGAGAVHLMLGTASRWLQIATLVLGLAGAGILTVICVAEGIQLDEYGPGTYLAAGGVLALLAAAWARPPARGEPAQPPPVAAGGYTA